MRNVGLSGMTMAVGLALMCSCAGTGGGAIAVSKAKYIKELPDPFLMNSSARVATRADWVKRRKEMKAMLLDLEYGHMPPPPGNLVAEETSSEPALEGAAIETRAVLKMGPEHEAQMQVGVYVPTAGEGPFPVIMAIEPVWQEHLWPVAKKVVERGYIFAGYERHDLDPDDDDRSNGVHPLYPDHDWASLAVWAWGALRMVDYLETLDAVDASHVALTGHSRAGKTALLAGALDERIALTAPHCSGCGGGGSFLVEGAGCETLELITQRERFHYWFHPRLRDFAGKEETLPFDNHFLKALVAPRAVFSMGGLEDRWANPVGTQAIWQASQPVFDWLGASGHNFLHFRPGGHDTTDGDWEVLLGVADHVFSGKPLPETVNVPPFPDAPAAFTWKAPEAALVR